MSPSTPGSSSASRVVVVTGAGSGIGRATAIDQAGRGHRVVLSGRSAESLQVVAGECAGRGGEVRVVPADVTDAAGVERLFADAVDAFGAVDAVVHCAATAGFGRFEDVPKKVFDQILETNVVGTANVARSALVWFRQQGGGHLLLVGSLLGEVSIPLMSPYVVSKWAIHGLARALQIESRQLRGVHVSLVAPASVRTPVFARAANHLGHAVRPPFPVAPPERVARRIARVLDRPRPRRKLGIGHPVVLAGYGVLPAVFDLLVTPLMRLLMIKRRVQPPTAGNVFAPDGGPDS